VPRAGTTRVVRPAEPTVRYADGAELEWEVEALDGGLRLGDEVWRRIDLDPEALRGEAEEPDGDEDDADSFGEEEDEEDEEQ